MSSEEKELDLFDIIKSFFLWLGNLFSKIGTGFLNFIRFTYKNLLLLFIFGLIGLALAFVLSRDAFKVYKSDTIYKVNNKDDLEILVGVIGALDKEIISEEPLATKLNISEKDAEAIVSIKPHYIIDYFNNGTPDEIDYKDKFVETDTINVKMKDRICVEVKTKDPYSFSNIQNGLITYFSNNELLKESRNLKDRQLNNQITTYKREIARLDSLSNFDYFNEKKRATLSVDSQAIMLGEKPRQLYYTDIVKLESTIDKLELALMRNNDVVVTIKPFTATTKAEKGFVKLGLLYGSVFLFLGYIVAVIKRYRKQMWKFLNKE